MARAARNDWVSLARDFGLTAASSARLPEVEDEDEEDPLAEFG
jgi:phage terminase small subunit